MRELIRRVEIQPLVNEAVELRMYDTNRTDNRGKTIIDVELDLIQLPSRERTTVFSGHDLWMTAALVEADDSDATLRGAISMVGMREGDTDPDWFEPYSPAQLDWAHSDCCEALTLYAMDPEDFSEKPDLESMWKELLLEEP